MSLQPETVLYAGDGDRGFPRPLLHPSDVLGPELGFEKLLLVPVQEPAHRLRLVLEAELGLDDVEDAVAPIVEHEHRLDHGHRLLLFVT